MYDELQTRAYENKIRKGFNVSDVGKEIICIVEEFGELCDAVLQESREDTLDAVGDIMIYCLGLSAMLRVNADEIVNRGIPSLSVTEYLPYLGKDLGLFAKTYRRSNKQTVDKIDKREELTSHLGNMIGYCSAMFNVMGVDERSALETIIRQNEQRTQQIKI